MAGPVVACANCGRRAGPRFCPHCGQEVSPRHGPLLPVVREILSDWLSLDGRLVRSLRTLVRPGALSERYVAGSRAPYLRPFRLYLVASVVLFSTVLTLEAPDADGMTLRIADRTLPAVAADEGSVRRSLELLPARTPWNRLLIAMMGERLDAFLALPRQELVDTLFVGFRRMLPLSLILFVPLLAAALKVLYLRGRARHRLYLDHLIFALHFQTALFLSLSTAWLTGRLLGFEIIGTVLLVAGAGVAILTVYLPMALRRFYGQSRRWTAVKTVAVSVAYSWLLGLVVDLSTVVAVWMA